MGKTNFLSSPYAISTWGYLLKIRKLEECLYTLHSSFSEGSVWHCLSWNKGGKIKPSPGFSHRGQWCILTDTIFFGMQ